MTPEAESSTYILVHADDFAIAKSFIRRDGERLKQTFRARCRLNVKKGIRILFTELDSESPPLPDYLAEFDDQIVRIPSGNDNGLEQQIKSLRKALLKQAHRTHYIFAGGWRDACLRYTVNQIAFRRPRFIVTEERLNDPEPALLKVPGYRERKITAQVDWQNVF